MLKHYSHVPFQSNRFKHLFEDEQHSLYVWVNLDGVVEKVQFEINFKSVIELDEKGVNSYALTPEEGPSKSPIHDIYSRSFQNLKAIDLNMEKAINSIHSEYEKVAIFQIKQMLINQKFEEVRFSQKNT